VLPTRALFLLLLLPFGLALVAIYDRSVTWSMLTADAAIFVVAGLDALAAWGGSLSVRREAPTVFSLGRSNRVRLSLRARSRRTLHVAVTDEVRIPGEVRGLPAEVRLRGADPELVEYAVEPSARGAHALGDHFLRIRSPLGLWVRAQRIAAAQEVRVYPDLKLLRAFDLLARQERHYAMLRAVRQRGGESEFERLREHSRDDEYRAIDWKATARKQRLIAREYQLESNQNLVFMLDAGRLMTAVVDGLSRLDHALNATLMLAHVAVRNGDRVGLVGFDDQVRALVEPTGGPQASRRLIRAAYDLHPQLVEPDFERAFATLATRMRRRALIVLFTHVVDDTSARRIAARVRAVSRQHLPLVVLFRDTDLDRLLAPRPGEGTEALYVRGAAAELVRWQESTIVDLKRAGAHTLHVGPRKLTTSVINRYLEIKARQLL